MSIFGNAQRVTYDKILVEFEDSRGYWIYLTDGWQVVTSGDVDRPIHCIRGLSKELAYRTLIAPCKCRKCTC